jgi:hypothetical protein
MVSVQLWRCFELLRAPLVAKLCTIPASKDGQREGGADTHRLVSSYVKHCFIDDYNFVVMDFVGYIFVHEFMGFILTLLHLCIYL